ncbi:minor capsid protein E [Clostridia bacterium]|nr:minor capsid protein E [Clostridia bacterium]
MPPINIVDLYTPRTMAKIVSRMPPVRKFFTNTLFRNVQTFHTKSIDVDFKKGNRALAPFVHPRLGSKTILNTGYQTKTYTPPVIAHNKITTVDDILARAYQESLYNGKTPEERAVIKLRNDYAELEEMRIRRIEWMAAQAIMTGKIPIVGEGINELIDFGFTQTETLTGTDVWTSANSLPLNYIKKIRKIVQRDGYTNPNVLLLADDVVDAFINNAQVQKLLDIKGYDLAVIKPVELPDGVTYIGTLKGLGLDVYTYDEWYLDDWTDPDAPVQKPLIPSGYIALLSTTAQFSLYYGAIEWLDNDGRWHTTEGERVPKSWVKHGPDRRFIELSCRPLPVPHEVNSWYVAKVI